ncbi:MAG TPA: cytochrome b [Stellaceae bacterium]|nr:cytochrome b [Stellaceae bacterium]
MAPSDRYGGAAITLHWLVATLIAAALVLAWVLPHRRDPGYDLLLELHKSVGISVLLLAVLRLCWRYISPVLPAPGLTDMEARGSVAIHALLYVIMIGIPLTGYLFSSAEGQSLNFFGIATFASPLATDQTFSRPVEFLHKAGQWAVYGAVGLHVLAALYHYFVRRDGVLQRMLPFLGSRAGAAAD